MSKGPRHTSPVLQPERCVLPLLFSSHRTGTAPSSQRKKAPTPRPARCLCGASEPRPNSNRLTSRLRSERSSQRASRAWQAVRESNSPSKVLETSPHPVPRLFDRLRSLCELLLRAKKKRPGNLLGHPASEERCSNSSRCGVGQDPRQTGSLWPGSDRNWGADRQTTNWSLGPVRLFATSYASKGSW